MVFKAFFLFFSLGNAAYIIEGGHRRVFTANEDPTEPEQVNGTITSVKVTGGIGCPVGSYQIGPFEPGKSLDTYVEFDTAAYVYNSSSTAPVDCTLEVTYDFVHPEGGAALVVFDCKTYNDARYDEGDTERTTAFITRYSIDATSGDDSISGGFQIISMVDGSSNYSVQAGLYPNGYPGQLDSGTFRPTVSIFPDPGPGEMTLSRIELGFGIIGN